METAEDELVTRPVSKNTIAAAGAPKLQTSAPNSVFALGVDNGAAQSEAPSSKPALRAPAASKERAIETIRSCGDLDKEQFASAMSISNAQAQKLLMRLQAEGTIKGTKVKGQLTRYHLVDVASASAGKGFKGWLARKAEPNAKGRTASKRTQVVEVESAPASTAPVDDGFVCGLFNTGELMLEADGRSMRLTKARTRALVAYLDKLVTAMEERSAA